MLTSEQIAMEVIAALNAANVPFMVVGSFSSNFHGIPRSTKDVDVVIKVARGAAPNVAAILGPNFVPGEQLRFETNTGTLCEEFLAKGSSFKVEVFGLSDDPHDQARFARRQQQLMAGQLSWLPTAEDVIIWKLRWRRPKDLEDVKAVIMVQSIEGHLDWPYIREWTAQHGTNPVLDELLQAIKAHSPALPVGG